MSTLLQRRPFSRPIAPPRRGPVSRLAAVAPAGDGGLRFTELLVLLALGLAYLFSISMPLFGVPLQITALKHVPLMVLAPALALHITGMLINRQPLQAGAVLRTCWPLVLMAVYATIGSLVGKEFNKTQEGFITFGVYLFVLPLLAMVAAVATESRRWVIGSAVLFVPAGLAALAGATPRLPQTGSLHETEYLVLTAFVMLWYLSRSWFMKLLALLLILAAAGVNNKLTGYIVAVLALLYIAFDQGWHRVDRKWRGFYVIGSLFGLAVVVALLALLYTELRSVLPTGSPEVRLKQYEEAWRQFTASPIWGYAYTESSGEDFRESTRLYNIPTHSDTLDMLKHGGLIAFGLFALGYFKIWRLLSKAAEAARGQHLLAGYFAAMRFFQLSALITFSLNPLLLKGPFLLVIWGNLGLAVGLALAALRRQSSAT